MTTLRSPHSPSTTTFYFFPLLLWQDFTISHFTSSVVLALNQASLINSPIIFFTSSFDLFYTMSNSSTLFIVLGEEIPTGSKLFLYFDLKLDVHFPSLKRNATIIPTLHRHTIHLTITRPIPTLVRPIIVSLATASSIPLLVDLTLMLEPVPFSFVLMPLKGRPFFYQRMPPLPTTLKSGSSSHHVLLTKTQIWNKVHHTQYATKRMEAISPIDDDFASLRFLHSLCRTASIYYLTWMEMRMLRE